MDSIFDLTGKTALVTGASSGFGAHFAEVLSRAGASLIIGARRAEMLAATAEKIVAAGGKCETISLDVTSPESIAQSAATIERADILINNAGIVRPAALLDHRVDDWDAVMDTNTKGMFLMTQAAAKGMKARGGGSIINIASILGLRQANSLASYAVSKAAAIQLTKVSALELARFGVRVNALAPGYVSTDLNGDFWESPAGKAMVQRIPQRRLGQLEDLDGPLLLLASDASAYMNGSIVEVDGGHLVSTL